MHTDASATVTLEALLTDGSPLPGWLAFDATTGTFFGTPPEEYEGSLFILVVARDTNGAEAEATFELVISQEASTLEEYDADDQASVNEQDNSNRASGKPGLGEQLKLASHDSLYSRAKTLLDVLLGLEAQQEFTAEDGTAEEVPVEQKEV